MSSASLAPVAIAPMSPTAIELVRAYERTKLQQPQVAIHTHHVLHAGMYTRTIVIPANTVLTGALVKIPTVLVISGDVVVSRGEDDGVYIGGTAVLPAGAGRKQVFVTYAPTTVTMVFPTSASTVEEAEAQFTDETDMLLSHRNLAFNTVIITGE